MSILPTYGEVHGAPVGEMSRRSFMRRIFWVGAPASSRSSSWPAPSTSCGRTSAAGLGGKFTLGTAADIASTQPDTWTTGPAVPVQQGARLLHQRPGRESLVENPDSPKSIPDPGDKVGPGVAPVDASVLALYRKCPHLGCQHPASCARRATGSSASATAASTTSSARSEPARLRAAWIASTLSSRTASYGIDTRAIVSGPPIGTATFDDRDDDQDPALRGLSDAHQDARDRPDQSPFALHRLLLDRPIRLAASASTQHGQRGAAWPTGKQMFGAATTRDDDHTANCARCHGKDGTGGRSATPAGWRRTCIRSASSRSQGPERRLVHRDPQGRRPPTTSTW